MTLTRFLTHVETGDLPEALSLLHAIDPMGMAVGK